MKSNPSLTEVNIGWCCSRRYFYLAWFLGVVFFNYIIFSVLNDPLKKKQTTKTSKQLSNLFPIPKEQSQHILTISKESESALSDHKLPLSHCSYPFFLSVKTKGFFHRWDHSPHSSYGMEWVLPSYYSSMQTFSDSFSPKKILPLWHKNFTRSLNSSHI